MPMGSVYDKKDAKRQEEAMNIKKRISLCLLLLLVPVWTGCWYAAAAGAGAYGGYKAKEKGYTLQSPVKKDDQTTKTQSKDKQ
jgi:hypothetical protein